MMSNIKFFLIFNLKNGQCTIYYQANSHVRILECCVDKHKFFNRGARQFVIKHTNSFLWNSNADELETLGLTIPSWDRSSRFKSFTSTSKSQKLSKDGPVGLQQSVQQTDALFPWLGTCLLMLNHFQFQNFHSTSTGRGTVLDLIQCVVLVKYARIIIC